MKRKYLIAGIAAVLVLSQASLSLGARSGGSSSSGTVADKVTVIDRTSGGSGSGGSSSGGSSQQSQPSQPAMSSDETTRLIQSAVPSASTEDVEKVGNVTRVDQTSPSSADQMNLTTATAQTATVAPAISQGETANATVLNENGMLAPVASIVGVVPAPQISTEKVAAETTWMSDQSLYIQQTTELTRYTAPAAGVIQTVNQNPAALASLPAYEDLNRFGMLTVFQQLVIKDAAGNTVAPVRGQKVAIEVPALVDGMKVYMLYVDPVTNYTHKVQLSGVDYASRTVLVDTSYVGAFSIVYEK